MTKWESYEEVTIYLLNQLAEEFGLGEVEGKQVIAGASTDWEIDAKGFCQDGSGFIIIECKRYTTSRPNQENAAALAYQIRDTGARGGIFVTPLGLQEGAERVAAAENIKSVQLNADGTRYDYVLRFLNRIMVGIQSSIILGMSVVEVEVKDKDGNIIHRPRGG